MEKETFNLLIGGLIALVSVIVGGLISVGGTEFKGWRDEKKNRRKVLRTALFHQLELYDEVIRLDPAVHESLSKTFGDLLIEVGVPAEKVEELDQFKPFLAEFTKKMLSGDIGAINEKYKVVVEDVASVDPLLAGRLNQRFGISRLNGVERVFGELTEPNKHPELQVITARLHSTIAARHHKSLIQSVEDSILETADLLGPDLRSSAEARIESVKRRFLDDSPAEVRILLASFINAVSGEHES